MLDGYRMLLLIYGSVHYSIRRCFSLLSGESFILIFRCGNISEVEWDLSQRIYRALREEIWHWRCIGWNYSSLEVTRSSILTSMTRRHLQSNTLNPLLQNPKMKYHYFNGVPFSNKSKRDCQTGKISLF